MENPVSILRAENQAILSILEVLEEICFLLRADQEILQMDLIGIADFLEYYCEIFHNGKESRFFYPVMEETGLFKAKPEAKDLVLEHETGRGFIAELKTVANSSDFNKENFIRHAESYIEHMRQHIDCEETMLFPLAQLGLQPGEQARIVADFARWEAEGIEADAAQSFSRLIQYFNQKYLRNT